MTLQDLGSVGEFIAAIATIGTLVYLALQIKQNTSAVRNQTTYGLVSAVSDATHLLATEAELAKIIAAGVYDRASLTSDEQLRFNAYLFGYLNKVEFAYDQYCAGGIDEKAWRKLEREIPVYLSLPGMNDWWTEDKVRFSEDFVAYFEAKIDAVGTTTKAPTIPAAREGKNENSTQR